MPPVVSLSDQTELVPTKKFPKKIARFSFENFNPVQSRIFEVYKEDANAIIAAATSAGKTCIAEMYMSHEVRKRGGKAIYLAPLKALAKEKIDEWTDKDHHFSDLNLSICTGDYRLTDYRKKELAEADIILMTSEMLSSRSRHYSSEKNEYLKDVGTIVVDESHLLTVPGRGDHLEVGLMKFSEIAENVRIVFLSATMPNVKEISEWVGYTLTQKDTYLLESEYRPCPLGIHFECYEEAYYYEQNEENKVNAALQIVQDHDEDHFLIFAHTKRTGNMMARALKQAGYSCEFHSSDIEKSKRHKIEDDFRQGKNKILVATSGLAWGLNTPARRVIILGIHRGLSEVETYDIWQMCGRSGRPGYDPRGDAYILLPESKTDEQIKRLKKSQNIESRLLDYVGPPEKPHYKTLAFHVVSEIHYQAITNRDDLHDWYERTLANFQAKDLENDIADNTLELLRRCGAVWEKDSILTATMIGRIASMFYYSPFDVSDLKRNFNMVFEHSCENDDLAVSIALGDVDSLRMGIVSKADREVMGAYATRVINAYGNRFMETSIKGGFLYYALLNGINPGSMAGLMRNLQFDFPRTQEVISAIDSMSAKWGKKNWISTLGKRIAHGVPEYLLGLCEIPNVGKVRAEKLWSAGIKDLDDVADNPNAVKKILNLKDDKIEEICQDAKKLSLTS